MKNRRAILIAHYIGLLKRSAVFAGLASLVLASFVPASALAYGQITSRSVTLSTSKAGNTTTTYTFAFKPATTETVGAVGFSMCDQPYEVNSTCAQSAGAAGGLFTSATFSAGGSSSDFSSGFAIGTAGNCGTGQGATTVCLYDGSGKSMNAGTAETVVFNSVKNPTTANSTFYLNIFMTTVAGAATVYTAPVDFGAVAASTGNELSVSASVQEALTFCVGATVNTTGTPCSTVGSAAVSLATSGSCPIMGATYSCTGTSQMDANTNASTGYAIYYDGSTFTNPIAGHTIAAIGSTVAASSAGTEQFGLAMTGDVVNSSETTGGTAILYQGGGTNYCYATIATFCTTANGAKYAYVTGGAGNTANTEVASATGPTADNIFTTTYLGNVSATTNPGVYTATVDYICTGNF
jgi:hypothetical protein